MFSRTNTSHKINPLPSLSCMCDTYPLQQAPPRWLGTGQLKTLSRSSCWLRSWSWTRMPLRAHRSQTLAFSKTSSSFPFSVRANQNAIPNQRRIDSAVQFNSVASPIYLSGLSSSPACSASGSPRGAARHLKSPLNNHASWWHNRVPKSRTGDSVKNKNKNCHFSLR